MPLSAERRRQLRAPKRPPQICYRCGKQMMKRLGAKYCSDACRQPLSPKAADHLVRRYFKRRLPPPETLGAVLRAIGLIPADARLLSQTFGPHYWPIYASRPSLAPGDAS